MMKTRWPSAETAVDEQDIRALKEVFAQAFVKKGARLRASIWAEDGTVVPPQGGFFQGRAAMEEQFATEASLVTNRSPMSFSNYRFRFISRDLAFVDAEITLNDVLGPDGKIHEVLAIGVVSRLSGRPVRGCYRTSAPISSPCLLRASPVHNDDYQN